jgi:thiamine monophosphate synthase
MIPVCRPIFYRLPFDLSLYLVANRPSFQDESLFFSKIKEAVEGGVSCPRNDELWGMEGLRNIRAISPHRIVAIGGLNLECAESVYRVLHFDDGIAMAGGLMGEEDPCATAQKIQAIRQRVGGGS